MEEITISLIASAIIGLFCVPFLLNSMNQKKKSKALINTLKAKTQTGGLTNGQFETLRSNYCLGLDKERKKVLFLEKENGQDFIQTIDLAQVKICKALLGYRSFKGEKSQQKIIEKVQLAFMPINDSKASQFLELYTESKQDYLVNEWEIAQKWESEINKLLN